MFNDVFWHIILNIPMTVLKRFSAVDNLISPFCKQKGHLQEGHFIVVSCLCGTQFTSHNAPQDG